MHNETQEFVGYAIKRVYAWFGFFTFWAGFAYGVGEIIGALKII